MHDLSNSVNQESDSEGIRCMQPFIMLDNVFAIDDDDIDKQLLVSHVDEKMAVAC